MNVCPYTNESACDLPSAEVENASTTAYCQKCSQVAFRCASGHWNRAFARYCTQCSEKLEKPAIWEMASANPHRTAIHSTDALRHNDVFDTWYVDIPEIKTGENLPGLLAIDGLVLVPNAVDERYDAYQIAKSSDQRSPSLKWSIPFNGELSYSSTPIYHGLHLYYVVSGGIQKKSVFEGEAKPVEVNSVDAAQIEPAPDCAPLKCDVDGKPTMVVGLEQGILLFDLINKDSKYIKRKFFSENRVMSPVVCGEYLVFTALRGQIWMLNIAKLGDEEPQTKSFRDISFSAPVSLDKKVYFEAFSDSGKRSLARFDPSSGKLSKAIDMDNIPERDFEMRRPLFKHPLLTNGRRLFSSDRSGQVIYAYDSESGFMSTKELLNNNRHLLAPHLSIIANNRIFCATTYGMTVLDIGLNQNPQNHPLGMGGPDNPRPITRPILYGDKLLILCKDRLICRDY